MTLNRPFQPPRVLIVEDEPELRKILRALIESIGFPVDESTNRQDGLAMLSGDRDIGIVLLDLGLPPEAENDSEGIAFLKTGQQRSSLTKIVVLTGRDSPDAALSAIEHGASDYLTKPFHMEELLARLRALNRRAHGVASAVLRLGDVASVEQIVQRVLAEADEVRAQLQSL